MAPTSIAMAVLFSLTTIAYPAAALVTLQGEGDLVAVNVEGDAHAERGIAISVFGDASVDDCSIHAVDTVVTPDDLEVDGCAAVSGSGDASTQSGASVSALGDATNRDCTDNFGSVIEAESLQCVAASGSGGAENGGGDAACSGGWYGSSSCLAVSILGDAANEGGDHACGSGSLNGWNCVALSGTGSATNTGGASSCNGYTALLHCVALSARGEASNAVGPGSCTSDTLTPSPRCIAIGGLLP